MHLPVQAKQKLWFQIVSELPKWTEYDLGRVIFVEEEQCVYVGSNAEYGKWMPIGGLNSITADQINWNYDFNNSEAIDAYDIPMIFGNNSFFPPNSVANVGSALNFLFDSLYNIINGNIFNEEIIKCRHINVTDFDRVNATCIPVLFDKFYENEYGLDFVSVEDALFNILHMNIYASRVMLMTKPLSFFDNIDLDSSISLEKAFNLFSRYTRNMFDCLMLKLETKMDNAPIYQDNVVTVLQRQIGTDSTSMSFTNWKHLHASNVHATRYIHEECIINYGELHQIQH